MANITLGGNPIQTQGDLPAMGQVAPAFHLTDADLNDVSLDAFKGKVKVLNITPSLDTDICAASAKRFDGEIGKLNNTALLHISADLPFAQKRFCSAEGLTHVTALSVFRSPDFARDYGVGILTGPMKGLLSRAVLVLDGDNKVVYAEQVPEIAQEPDYDAALDAARDVTGAGQS